LGLQLIGVEGIMFKVIDFGGVRVGIVRGCGWNKVSWCYRVTVAKGGLWVSDQVSGVDYGWVWSYIGYVAYWYYNVGTLDQD